MDILRCLSCGSLELVKQGSYYVCPYCRSNYQDRDGQEFIEKLNRMILFFDDRRYSDAHALSVEILGKQPNNTLAEYYRALSCSTFDSIIYLDDDAAALQKALWAYQQQVGNSASYFVFAVNQARAFMNMANYVAERRNYGRVTTTVLRQSPAQAQPPADNSDGVGLGVAGVAAAGASAAIRIVTGSSILGAVGGGVAGVLGGVIGGTVDAVSKANKAKKNAARVPVAPQVPEVMVTVQQGEMDKIAKWLIGAVNILYKPVRDMSQAGPQFFAVQHELINLAEQLGGNQNLGIPIRNTRAFIAANQNKLAQSRQPFHPPNIF